MSAAATQRQRLDELATAVCDGAIGAAEQSELRGLLGREPSLRRRYVLHLQLHALAEREEEVHHQDRWAATAAVERDAGVGRGALRRMLGYFARPTPLSVAAAVLCMGALIAVMALVAPPFYRQLSPRGADPAPVVAELIAVNNAVWSAAQTGLSAGAQLRAGDRLQLAQGLAALRLGDKTRVVLEGPCEFVLNDAGRGTLVAGKLSAKVPRSASGFVVATRWGEIVDLGTEFGVQVDDEGVVSRVYEGKVEFRPTGQKDHSSEKIVLGAGQTLRITRGGAAQLDGAAAGAVQFARNVPAVEASILFDFGLPAHTTDVAYGAHWNNVAFAVSDSVTGKVVAGAIDARGRATGISMTLDDPGDGHRCFVARFNVPGLRVNSPSGVRYPESATRDTAALYHAGQYARRRVITLTGLQETPYDVLLFSSTADYERTSYFRIGDATKSLPTRHNRDQFAIFSGVAPIAGRIEIEFYAGGDDQIANLCTLELVPHRQANATAMEERIDN